MSDYASRPMRSPSKSNNPIRQIVDLFSSIWTGVTLLILLFIYSSIGSAVPQIRQMAWIEKTEFEWFNWWPFQVLIGLFCLNITVVTLRRIPLRVMTFGVWMIHGGILILCAGSFMYFSTKVEGDIPVMRRQVVIDVPGAKGEARMPALPGNETRISGLAGTYTFQVANIQPEWPILSGEHKGKSAYSVSVMVQPPSGEPFIRQLLANYPQFTEDVIPGKGRAVKETGEKLLDSSLDMTLDYLPQDHFFLQKSTALYVREKGTSRWIERPVHGMPHYNERFSDAAEVWSDGGTRIRPIDLDVEPAVANDPLKEVDVRVKGFLPYATMTSQWVGGGEQLNPVVGFRLQLADQTTHHLELAAFHPSQEVSPDQIAFHWIESMDELEKLSKADEATLRVEVPGASVDQTFPLSELVIHGHGPADYRPIEGTDYEFRVRNSLNRFPMNDGTMISALLVDIRSPEGAFTRMVADDPERSRDMSHSAGHEGHDMTEPDPRIVMSYVPDHRAALNIVAGPDPIGTHVLTSFAPGSTEKLEAPMGKALALSNDWQFELLYLHRSAVRKVRPQIIPHGQRDRDAGRSFAMLQVSLSDGDWQTDFWMPYHQYVFPSEHYRYSYFRYAPTEVRLPGGRVMELMYSRQSHPLPAPVALDEFTLLTHQGGLIGTNSNVRDYISQLRFAEGDGKWSEPVQLSLNQPVENKGFWFFQSFWDTSSGGAPRMSFTGLGVGNRNGVYVQLAGTIIAVLGMIYTFYLKPIVMRRKLANAMATADTSMPEEEPVSAAASTPDVLVGSTAHDNEQARELVSKES